MSGVDAPPSSSLTSNHDSDADILDHDLLSPSHHADLPPPDHQVVLELELACLAQSNDPVQMALQHTRDHIFGDIDHVADHVKDDHITMVEAVDPAVTQQDSQQQSPEASLELKRVKVYELVGSRWVDQGTAYCSGQLDDANQAYLVARSEADFNKIILSTAIRSNDVYQRQQESLIVWTEPNGADYALSFQDPEGCAEVWNFIIEVQRHLNTGEDQGIGSSSPGGDHSATAVNIIRTGHLPTPQLGNIQDIEGAIKTLARGQTVKEKICEYIQRENYIKALIDVLNMAEDLESLDNLHALCSLIQTILMMNDHGIYEHILEDDIFFGVVGMLEYDPEFPTHKANYREFLHVNTHFHQPIPIRDDVIRKKVHHTYRLQFLKDVVLARALDDSTFNVLNSCIIFNQIDIISHIQSDPVFLHDIVRLYVSEEVLMGPRRGPEDDEEEEPMGADGKPREKLPNGHGQRTNSTPFSFGPPGDLAQDDLAFRREVVVLVQQLCAMGKNVQLPARLALFRTLVDRGILFAVQWAFSLQEKEEASKPVISAAGEILSILLDHDLHGVRGHVSKQAAALEREKDAGRLGADKAETLLKLMCRVMVQSRDVAVQSLIGDSLKALLDVSQSIGGPGTPAAISAKILARPKDDPGTERFLDYFYKNCLEILFRPYGDIPDFRKQTDPVLKLSREKTNLLLYLSDLLCNFAQQHAFRSHFYMLSSNMSTRVATLLSARDKHLRLAAFRFFRTCLKINNKNFLAHLIKLDVFKPILELTSQESHRDSLLSASCQEFFEHMRRENIKDLINHCMTVHGDIVRKLSETTLGGARFSAFIRRWEINVEPPPKEQAKNDQASTDSRRVDRSIDAEEEEYFNGDDDEVEAPPPFISSALTGRGSPLTVFKHKRRTSLAPPKVVRPPGLVLPRTPPLPSLLDYGDDDDAEIGPPSPPGVSSPAPPSKASSKENSPAPLSPSLDIPPSPRLAHRQIPRSSSIPRRRSHEENDSILETLMRAKAAPTSSSSPSPAPAPTPSSPSPSPSPSADKSEKPPPKSQIPRIRLEKRRRESDDDDDELLERLASKPKRADLGKRKGDEPVGGRAIATKPGDDPPKRMKMMFRPLSGTVAQSASHVPPDPGAKDGDTG